MSKDIQQQKKLKVLLIGDSCVDEYYYGRCVRLNPESPSPLLNIKNTEILEGMSGNVKKNLEGLGMIVDHFTNKEEIKKTRFVDDQYNVQLLRVDKQPNIKKIDISLLKDELNSKVKDLDCVVFSDYDKGYLEKNDMLAIIEYVRSFKKDLRIFIDTKKRDLSNFENCYIKVNEAEYESWIKHPKENCKIIVTLGEKGAMFKSTVYPAKNINLNSVTNIGDRCGAGDTFFSGFIYYSTLGNNIPDCISFANYCAALSVKKIGVYQLKEADLENFCV